jgi:hypothetical protein
MVVDSERYITTTAVVMSEVVKLICATVLLLQVWFTLAACTRPRDSSSHRRRLSTPGAR